MHLLGALAGGLAGFFYWNYIGCMTGSCAITSHPWMSTAYFALLGSLFPGMFAKRKQQVKDGD